jgi:hypothetical protein
MRMAQKKMTPKMERSPMEEHLWKMDLDGKVIETQAPGNGNGVPPSADGQ